MGTDNGRSEGADGNGHADFLSRVLARAGNLGVCRLRQGNPIPDIVYWNEGIEALTGYSSDEIRKQGCVQKLFAEPEVQERVRARMLQVVGGSPTSSGEWEIQRPDGERRIVELSLSLIASAAGQHDVLLQMSDATAKHQQLRESQQQSARFLEDVIESIQDGVCVLDTELNIVHVNGVMRSWYEENLPLVGKRCYECYHNRTEPCDPCPTLRALHAGESQHDVVPGLAGSPVEWVELFSYPIQDRATGKVTGVVEFVRDITEKRRLETKLLQAQKMEAIGTLASGIAHDFNNILTGILATAELVAVNLDPTDPLAVDMQDIEEYVESATSLTGQLLGLARGGKHDPKPTDPNKLLSRTLDLFGRSRKELTIHQDYQEPPWSVVVDRGQIEQVVLNLLVNAWQAMPRGGEVYVVTENIVITPEDTVPDCEPGRYMKISITDTGIGMDRAVQARIFDPFFTTKDRARGTGLGLASSYGIVRNHGGVIHVYSEPDKGSTFSLYLPANKDVIEATPKKRNATPPAGGTVLLVDDEEPVRRGAAKMLEWFGYEVLVASSGVEAVALFSKERARIDIVILDLVMPGMSGPQTYDALKEIDPRVKTLLSSGYSVNGEAATLLERGCDGFLQKPFRMENLGLKLKEILGGD